MECPRTPRQFLAPFLASLALRDVREPGRRWLGYALGVAALCCACDAVPYTHTLTDRWLKPLAALLFLPVLIHLIFERKKSSYPRRRA